LATRAKKIVIATIVAALLFTGVLLDAFLIEPYRIEVSYHQVQARIGSPIKIAHLTDLHSGGVGTREEKLLAILETERPDLIVITGDLISVSTDYAGCREVLKRMHAPLGVWVTHGNHEVWWPIPNEEEFYESAGVKRLVNSSRQISTDVWLVGLDDSFAGSPDIDCSVAAVPPTAYRIALFHSPSFFDRMAGSCELALAGHSHGGQIRLPFVGPLWVPPETGEYVAGWFEKRSSRMYVSRGIGTSILAARFLCRPEVAIITLGE
jgi:predicted MPP superfamily phosphohydrolase